MRKVFSLILILGGGIACSSDADPTPGAPNILLIIADDMGLDSTPGYDVGNSKPEMPNILRLGDEGMRFVNAWSAPTCSPTRATILTGKYGFETGVLDVFDGIRTNETSIFEFIDLNSPHDYSSTLIGKWHLSSSLNDLPDLGIPNFSVFERGGLDSYFNWPLITNTNTINQEEYSTTVFTNIAIDWIQEQNQPWFLWLAYNAPHTPFHLPPSELHSRVNLVDDENTIESTPRPYYLAALEALDNEIGRLLDSLTPQQRENTYIIFVGDNGTPSRVSQNPYPDRKAKGTLYQGGINIPLIIQGPDIESSNSLALANTTDLFSTIASMAGIENSDVFNSNSLLPVLQNKVSQVRSFTYSEASEENTAGIAIRGERYKWIKYESGEEEFYDLQEDPYEENDIFSNLSAEESNEKMKLEEIVNQLKN